MPDPYGTIAQSIQNAYALRMNNRAQLQQMRDAAMTQRLMMQNALISARMQNSPAMIRAKLAQQKQAEQASKDQAVINWVMSLDPQKVEPQWRYYLSQVQASLKGNPDPDVAKLFTSKYRPQGLQFKTVTTVGYDDSGNEIPMTSAVAFDPMSSGLRAISAPGGLATAPPGVSAPSSGSRSASGRSGGASLSSAGAAFGAKYGLTMGGP